MTQDLKPTPVINESQPANPKAVISALPAKAVAKFKNFQVPPKAKKILIIIVTLFVILLLLAVFAPFILKKINSVMPLPGASPSPSPMSSPTDLLNPSEYADDPDVLAIEEDIAKLEEDLKNSSLREDKLRIPNLDWDVSFKED